MEGVYLSATLDIEQHIGAAFDAHRGAIRLRRPEDIDDPKAVRFAVAWQPSDFAFERYPNVKMVASIAAGVDSIVNCPSLPDDAVVTRVRDDSQGDLMAGFAAWHVIWHHRAMQVHLDAQAQGRWRRQRFDNVVRPRDCPVGILGFGLMGRAVARAVTGMGFPVIAAVRSAPKGEAMPGVSFETGPGSAQRTAARARMLINVLPLTEATRDILSAGLFDQMPMGAVLIQLGRGEHLVEADLDAALDSGRLSAASLDVFRREPLPPEHPWWRDPRILITPHQASDTAPELVARQIARAVHEVMDGRTPDTAVDRASGY
ncbi:NAD(P)-dependent oxidoreductase [Breoghania sp. L-A4]|uniref:NAD(P)-dependent oxidoreductase n=1 Tax=Breoghania sp. L-A4 TaxID=2304600 RepID=UPI0020BE714D|nr:NAD(P)-dependent oxidoreductase [Breoghania sp. L-A4]